MNQCSAMSRCLYCCYIPPIHLQQCQVLAKNVRSQQSSHTFRHFSYSQWIYYLLCIYAEEIHELKWKVQKLTEANRGMAERLDNFDMQVKDQQKHITMLNKRFSTKYRVEERNDWRALVDSLNNDRRELNEQLDAMCTLANDTVRTTTPTLFTKKKIVLSNKSLKSIVDKRSISTIQCKKKLR